MHIIPMSALLWQAIDETEGLEAVVELEQERGYLAAQEQVTTYLSDRDWRPLAQLLAERLARYDPAKHIAFLTRVAAMAPGLYHMSKLLDQMQGKTRVTTVLFYPGSIEGTTGSPIHGSEGPRDLGQLSREDLWLRIRPHGHYWRTPDT